MVYIISGTVDVVMRWAPPKPAHGTGGSGQPPGSSGQHALGHDTRLYDERDWGRPGLPDDPHRCAGLWLTIPGSGGGLESAMSQTIFRVSQLMNYEPQTTRHGP